MLRRLLLLAALLGLVGCLPRNEIPDAPLPDRAALVASFGDTALGTFELLERDVDGYACTLDSTSVFGDERYVDVSGRDARTERRVSLSLSRRSAAIAAGDSLRVTIFGSGCGRSGGEGYDAVVYVTESSPERLGGVFAVDLRAICGPTGCGLSPRDFRLLGGFRVALDSLDA